MIIAMNSDRTEQRNITLDVLKGLGIILMIIGHVPSPIRKVIFSFHMPLFFFISGYLYKDRKASEIIAKNARKVLLPYFLTCLFIWLIFIIKDEKWQWGISIFLANGTDTVWGMSGLMVGPLWFLVCYVVAVLGFHFILRIKSISIQVLVLLSLWVTAFIIKRLYGLQPMCILNSVPAIFCLWMGYSIKNENIRELVFSRPATLIGLFVWIICLLFGSVSMAGLTYRLWILQLVGAFYAVYFLYVSLNFCRSNRLCWRQVLARIGKWSLAVLCIHSVDYMLNISSSLISLFNMSVVIGIPLNMLLKLFFAIMGVVTIKQIPLLRRVFEIN